MADDGGRLLANRYRVIDRLGSGGSAAVFLAEDTRLGRQVAIKRLYPENVETTVARFHREAVIGASLNHPNTVRVYDAVVDGDVVFIAMEYVAGETLAKRIARGPLPVPDALPILRAVASALDHAHRSGVIHRDVKPANVLVGGSGQAKLADLGIAAVADVTRITSTGMLLGTPNYIAPELLGGGAATPASDLWSLAAVAFEVLSGRPARRAGTPIEVATRALVEPSADLRDVMPGAPTAAADALARGMARDPAQRPRSCLALVEGLAAACQPTRDPTPDTASPPPTSRPPAPASRRRAPALTTLGALAAVLVLGVATALAVTLAGGRAGSTGAKTGGKTTGTAAGSGAGLGSHPGHPPSATASPTPTKGRAADTPAVASEHFYRLAAGHDYPAAWALAAPSFRQQLGGYDSFRATFADVRSIDFARAGTLSLQGDTATVSVATTVSRTDGVQHCAGTVDTVQTDAGRWSIGQIHIHC